jgi:hypothetical protein
MLPHEMGKAIYQQDKPQVTAPAGSIDWNHQRQQELAYNKEHPWGDPISAHPGILGSIAHVLAKVGNIAGDVVAPSIMANIPGTEMHNEILGRQLEKNIERQQGIENQTTEAGAKETAANAEQEKADTEQQVADQGGKPTKPEPIYDKNGAIVGFNTGTDLLSLDSPALTPDMKAIAGASKPKETPAHLTYDQGIPVSVTDKTGKVFDVNDPKLPPELKSLVDTANRAHGQHVKEDSDKQAASFAQQEKMFGKHQDAAKQKDTDKKTQDLQSTIDEIAESREYAATPSATNDYGLLMNFIGVTKPESLAKLRLNQNEVHLATGTRGTLGDIKALVQKVENGEMLTPEQRQEMLKTMGIVEKFAQRRMQGIGGNAGTSSPTQNTPAARPSFAEWKQSQQQ